MKKTYVFVDDKVIVRTEQELHLLVKSKRGSFLAEDEKGNLYSNNEQWMAEDLLAEDPFVDAYAWAIAQTLLQRMMGGVREI